MMDTKKPSNLGPWLLGSAATIGLAIVISALISYFGELRFEMQGRVIFDQRSGTVYLSTEDGEQIEVRRLVPYWTLSGEGED